MLRQRGALLQALLHLRHRYSETHALRLRCTPHCLQLRVLGRELLRRSLKLRPAARCLRRERTLHFAVRRSEQGHGFAVRCIFSVERTLERRRVLRLYVAEARELLHQLGAVLVVLGRQRRVHRRSALALRRRLRSELALETRHRACVRLGALRRRSSSRGRLLVASKSHAAPSEFRVRIGELVA